MKNHALIGFVGLLASSCMQQPAATVDVAAETTKLLEAVEAYNSKVIATDFDAVKTFYASNAIIMPPDEATVRDTEAVNRWVDGFKEVKNFKASFNTEEVVVYAGGTSGHSLATANLTMDGPDGKTVSESGVRDYHVWSKQADGSWKVIVDIWNNSAPVE
jgi:ketosteroid isomerase-like protein